MGTSALKFSVKLLPTNMGFVNYSGLKFSSDIQGTEKLYRGVLKSSCSTLTHVVVKYLNFRSSGSKLENVNA